MSQTNDQLACLDQTKPDKNKDWSLSGNIIQMEIFNNPIALAHLEQMTNKLQAILLMGAAL